MATSQELQDFIAKFKADPSGGTFSSATPTTPTTSTANGQSRINALGGTAKTSSGFTPAQQTQYDKTLALMKATNNQGNPITTTEFANTSGTQMTVPPPPTTNNLSGVGAGSAAYMQTNPPPTVTPTAPKSAADAYRDSMAGVTTVNSEQILKDLREQEDTKAKGEAARKLKARIDSINAQATAAQQTLESEAGTGKDVTGTFLGRQQQEISRQAAIQTLPLTAEYQAALGDYQAAQDTVNQLFTAKLKDAESQYDYKIKAIESAYNVASAEEKKQLDALQRAEDIKLAQDKETIAFERDKELLKYKESSSGGSGMFGNLPTSTQNKVISIANGFGSESEIKRFKLTVDAVNTISSIDKNTKNPALHQSIIYNFAKALDPESVVREGEYATVKKYSQSIFSKYKGEINQAINGTGFLSPKAIEDIQGAIQNLYDARLPQYKNSFEETSRIIDNIAGAPVSDELMIDYRGGRTNESPVDLSGLNFKL